MVFDRRSGGHEDGFELDYYTGQRDDGLYDENTAKRHNEEGENEVTETSELHAQEFRSTCTLRNHRHHQGLGDS